MENKNVTTGQMQQTKSKHKLGSVYRCSIESLIPRNLHSPPAYPHRHVAPTPLFLLVGILAPFSSSPLPSSSPSLLSYGKAPPHFSSTFILLKRARKWMLTLLISHPRCRGVRGHILHYKKTRSRSTKRLRVCPICEIPSNHLNLVFLCSLQGSSQYRINSGILTVYC